MQVRTFWITDFQWVIHELSSPIILKMDMTMFCLFIGQIHYGMMRSCDCLSTEMLPVVEVLDGILYLSDAVRLKVILHIYHVLSWCCLILYCSCTYSKPSQYQRWCLGYLKIVASIMAHFFLIIQADNPR